MPSKDKAAQLQKKGKTSVLISKVPSASSRKPAAKSPKAKILERAENSDSEDEDVEAEAAGEDLDQDSEDEGSDDDDVSDSEDDENEDVDEQGMERLMKLLGEDGLDDIAKSELGALAADEEVSDEEDGEGDDKAHVGSASEGEDVDLGESRDEQNEQVSVAAEEDEAALNENADVLLEDADYVDEDAVPRQKIEIDNKIALERIRDDIKLDPSLAWTETLVVTYSETINADVDDDLNRELAFYKQALHCAQTAKALAAKHDLPFTRPSDYFAEMVKSDSHMERIRQRLLDEGASIKRSEEKRKEREGKKFGKQVQIEKLKERERSKKDMEERLKGLKRKRKGALENAQEDDEGFNVAVEDAIADRPSKRSKQDAAGGKKHVSRQARDKKYGFGGAGRRSKQNTTSSTDNFDSRSAGRPQKGGKKGSVKAKRPGKSRRVAARSRT